MPNWRLEASSNRNLFAIYCDIKILKVVELKFGGIYFREFRVHPPNSSSGNFASLDLIWDVLVFLYGSSLIVLSCGVFVILLRVDKTSMLWAYQSRGSSVYSYLIAFTSRDLHQWRIVYFFIQASLVEDHDHRPWQTLSFSFYSNIQVLSYFVIASLHLLLIIVGKGMRY